jgi:hypothetical protein
MNKQIDRGYHLDYCFIPDAWLEQSRIDVPDPRDPQLARWLGLSDHVPLVVDIPPTAAPPNPRMQPTNANRP